ncbi:uroporphyrinogen-III synthase [Cellulomonas sp. HZM]|uniref:uroporphyrinogen-III synthase n=1 Tax=Cellulomonas sp. HZM TaxID=1454010 RepID=UPI0004932B96|nr:uroporphyrinogen-III synthase [Cellulomonas sp. HZM]
MTEALEQVLSGCVVLVTADRRAGELGGALSRRGATVRHAPSLSMLAHVDDANLVATTRDVIATPPDVVVVTTGIGFRAWIEAADAVGLVEPLTATLAGTRIVARGPKARGAIQAAGLVADWVAESETSAEIAELLLDEGVAGLDVVVQHHGAGDDGLSAAFCAAGARVRNVVLYRWGPPADPQLVRDSVRAVVDHEIDVVTFTSAPGAAAWLDEARRIGLLDAVVASGVLTAAVGPLTARPLLDVGLTPLIPDRGRLGSFVRAIVAHYSEQDAVRTVGGLLRIRRGGAALDGRVLPLTPSGLAVLRLLAHAHGAVVTRDDVLDVLPGASRDPHTAEVAVGRLREVVGREVVRTVVKRGYRLELEEP